MLRCSMPSSSWIPQDKEQVASNECVYRGNMPLCGYSPIFCKSIPTTVYQTFLFVPDSIKQHVAARFIES